MNSTEDMVHHRSCLCVSACDIVVCATGHVCVVDAAGNVISEAQARATPYYGFGFALCSPGVPVSDHSV